MFEQFGDHFGSQHRSGKGTEHEVTFGTNLKRCLSGLGSRTEAPPGSPGLGPDRRGAVGEG